MRGVPGDLTTSTRPPTTIPLRHFLVALAFLVGGGGLALCRVAGLAGAGAGLGGIAVAHLLLVGWVCLTIIGAMTQFVPVWSGVEIHSERLATLQLVAVAVGVGGFAAGLWLGRPGDAALMAGVMALGIAVFAYNVARTLWRARPFDTTEAHFALAVLFLALAAVLGVTLAADYRWGVLAGTGLSRPAVVDAHVTLAVLGAVVTTVIGALYQLGPMFTQTDALSVETRAARVETAAYPVGVGALAAGRLVEQAAVAAVGGLLVAGGVAVAGAILLRRIRDATGAATPMLSRYAVVALASLAWSATAAATWVRSPLGAGVRFGHPAVGPVLLGALVGFVVVGSLYHVVPFIVWLDRYADRVGLERVPAIDDLYDARTATADLAATLGGAVLVLAAAVSPAVASFGGDWPLADGVGGTVHVAGGALIVAGALLFAGNMADTVRRHGGPELLRRAAEGSATETPEASDVSER
ncbi:hypothetical protein DJ69_16715 [Halorubrum persicum]|uniref:Uncharacterized protein n=1 Tax=Halorubrum persicum TaxID=1383844 RepID=A0A2G1WET7_9EURY|nr:hypothetical protein [Halorubrum persicum]PHQ37493.1 hypothetical protein DJ69_16715 [Halorubrum persicum]